MSSPYDEELIQLAGPALVAMMLDPIIGMISAGVQAASNWGSWGGYCVIVCLMLYTLHEQSSLLQADMINMLRNAHLNSLLALLCMPV